MSGHIQHPLVFTVEKVAVASNGDDLFISPPACRNDGDYVGNQYPLEGMLFQLDPSYDEDDFESWGLNEHAKVVARALQEYGMYLADGGSDMYIQGDPSAAWADSTFTQLQAIPASEFEAVDLAPIMARAGFDPNSGQVPPP